MNNISNDGENNIINNNNITYKFVPGARRGSELLYLISEKQLYKKKSAYKGTIRYCCYQSAANCKASVIMNTETNEIVKPNDALHIHPFQDVLMRKFELQNAIKVECGKLLSKLNFI